MGTRHTKGSQNTPRNNVESHWIPAGFCFFVFFFFPLLLGHMLLTRFSAREKGKEYRAMGWGRERWTEGWTRRDKPLSRRVTHKCNC